MNAPKMVRVNPQTHRIVANGSVSSGFWVLYIGLFAVLFYLIYGYNCGDCVFITMVIYTGLFPTLYHWRTDFKLGDNTVQKVSEPNTDTWGSCGG